MRFCGKNCEKNFLYTFLHEKHKDMAPALSEAIKAVKAKK